MNQSTRGGSIARSQQVLCGNNEEINITMSRDICNTTVSSPFKILIFCLFYSLKCNMVNIHIKNIHTILN